MALKTLRECPGFTIDADAIAKGVLDMMREQSDDNETLIRFGMLPKEWMDMVEGTLRSTFVAKRGKYPNPPGKAWDGDTYIALLDESKHEQRFCEFSMKKLVAEALHEIALALYDNVEMVV